MLQVRKDKDGTSYLVMHCKVQMYRQADREIGKNTGRSGGQKDI